MLVEAGIGTRRHGASVNLMLMPDAYVYGLANDAEFELDVVRLVIMIPVVVRVTEISPSLLNISV